MPYRVKPGESFARAGPRVLQYFHVTALLPPELGCFPSMLRSKSATARAGTNRSSEPSAVAARFWLEERGGLRRGDATTRRRHLGFFISPESSLTAGTVIGTVPVPLHRPFCSSDARSLRCSAVCALFVRLRAPSRRFARSSIPKRTAARNSLGPMVSRDCCCASSASGGNA